MSTLQTLAESRLARRGARVCLLAVALAALLASGCSGVTGGSNSNLTANPSSVSFGDVATGNSSTRSVTVTNASASGVSVSNVSISGAGFSASGVPAGLVLAPGESAALNVTFAPTSTGKVSGNVVISEEAFLTSATIPLSGNGIASSGHSVTLTWNASSSNVAGYRAYRSSASGGPYTSLNPAPTPNLRWTDSTVQAGTTYYYVVTALAADSAESAYSNQASANIPKP
jgi:hypothetical protein